MQKCPPETVQWIQKVRISWKNGLSFKLKHRNAQKHKLGIFFGGGGGGKAVERAGALVPTIGTGNEKRRRFVDNEPLWKGYAKKREQMSDKICEAWPIFSLKRKTFFFTSLQASQVIKLKHFWEARVYKIFFNPRHLYWNVTMPSILETTAETPSTCYARW